MFTQTLFRRSRRFAQCTLAPLCAGLLGLFAAGAAAASPAGFDLRPELTGQAIFSCQAMGLSGSVVVDSRGSVGGAAQGEEGHLRSNAGITLSGNVQVWGDAWAGPGAQVTRTGNATVHGQTGSAPSPLACVPIALAPLEAQLLAGNDNARIPRTDKNKLALGGADGRTFTLSGNDGITLPPGNYFFSSLNVSGNSTIRLEGRVNILVKGHVSVSGGGVLRQVGNVFQLRLWTRGNMAFSSQTRIQGFFYAPEGSIGISGGAHVEGTLFARSLTLSGTSTVRRSVDDGPPSLTLTAPAEGQTVAGCTLRVEGEAADTEENGLAVTVNGQPAPLDANGRFAVDLALGGADPSLVVVTATDGGGEIAQLSRRVVLLPPFLTLTSPPPGSLVGQNVVPLAGGAGHATALQVDGIAAALSGGSWQIPAFALGADGPKTISLVAQYCGGTASADFVLDLDTAAPVVVIDGPLHGDLFALSPIDVTGTIDEAHLASLKVAGIDATVEGGRFLVQVPLTEGVQSLQAVAVDALGRTGTSSPISVELDLTAPEVAIDSPATGTVVGTSPIEVGGHSEDINLQWVKVNGQTATLSGGIFTVSIALTEEENSVVAVARDRAGNTTTSPAVQVVLDTIAPVVSITAGELPQLTREPEVTVIGSALDRNLAAVEVNGVAATLAGESFSVRVPLAEGPNELVATASDVLAASLSGHRTASAVVVVVRDSTPPTLAVAAPAAGELLGSRSVTVRGSAADAQPLRVTVGGEPVELAAGAFETIRELGEGPQTIAVRAVDSLDQATELAVEVVVDTLAPQLEVTEPLAGALVAGATVRVAGRAADPHLEGVTVNGVAAAVGEDGSFELTLELAGTRLTVVATDLLGHETERQIEVIRESRPPEIAFDPALGGVCSPGGAIAAIGGTFADDQAEPPSIGLEVRPPAGAAFPHPVTVDAASGRFSAANVDLGQLDGLVTLIAKATDATGATGQAVASIRVDATPPQLQLTEGGVPFPQAAPGASPPAGAQPSLLGRQVAFGALVVDGGASAPPVPVFVLDGQPYQAGAPISAAGNHLLVATVTDCAGRAVSAHAYFRLDRSAPQLLSTLPAQGAALEEGPASFAGTSDPDLASATVDGRPAAVSNGSFSLAPFAWREGLNPVEIELIDTAGLRAIYRRSFTVASAPLSLSIQESGLPIAPGQLFTRPPAPRLVASAGDAAVLATLNGSPYVSGTPIEASGSYLLAATATLGGRTASASATFRIDLSPGPTITITAPADASEVAGPAIEVRGTVGGESPTVTVDGRPAVVQGGVFSLADYQLPENEMTTITAVAEDRLGRQASAQVTVLPRSSGPQLLILDPAEGTVTGRDRIDVAGAVVELPGELASPSVTITGGAEGPVAAPVAADGSFRARDVRLAEGANLLTVQAVDRFGRTGSAAVAIFRDGRAPSIALSANGQPLQEGAIFGGDVALTVAFSDDSGTLAERTLRLNGQLLLPAGDSHTLSLTEEGGYLISATGRDGAGNEARAERSFVLDRGGCRLGEIFPPAGSAVDADAVTLSGSSGDAIAIQVRVPSGAGVIELSAELADGTFLLAGVPLPQAGENRLELVCRDAAGRVDPIAHPLRRVDAGQGPTIEILSPADNAILGSERTAVSGTLSGGEASVNGVAATVAGSGGSFSLPQLTLAEGPNVIVARAVDAGRQGKDRIVVWRDTQAPRIVITSPDSGAMLGIAGSGPARVDVSGRVELTDEAHLATVRVHTAAGEVSATVDPKTGAFVALAVPLSAGSVEAAQTVTAEARDSLGHVGVARAEVFVDSEGPAIVLSAPADLGRYGAASPPQIPVTGEVWAAVGAVVSVNGGTLNDNAIVWDAAGPDGRRHGAFSAQIALPARDGSFGVLARVVGTDQRYAEARRLLIKDSVAPAVVEILPAAGSSAVDGDSMAMALFSEAVDTTSLPAVNGLGLWRLSTGERIAVTYATAGNAVALVPAASLVPGERYEVRAGIGIRDLAGQPLAAAREADFTVATQPLPAAPELDPLPAVLCSQELTLTGRTAAGASVKVRDGQLVFTASADAEGRFAVRLPLAKSGWHYLSVFVFDEAAGSAGPSVSHALRVDCSAPIVRDAVFDRATGIVTLFFSESMDESSLTLGSPGDAIRLRDAEDPESPLHAGVLLAGSVPNSARIQLAEAADAWWRDRPVRLQVGAPARDLRGNPMTSVFEQVFFPSSIGLAGGFLFGEAWDDTLGRPLAGARSRLYAGAAGAGAPLAEADTDGRGRYTFAGQVPAGRYAVLIEKPGFTPVVRRLALEPARGAVPFDARLTPRPQPLAEAVDPAAGGSRRDAAGQALEATAAGLPGADPLEIQLTGLSGQGLPDFLPLGYTPLAAAELRLLDAGQPLGEAALFGLGNVTVELPLPASYRDGDALIAAQYEMATGRWLALQDPEIVDSAGGRAARLAPLGPGTVAVVMPDRGVLAPPPAQAFAALEGVVAPAPAPAFEAVLSLDPPVVAPTGRSLARLVARSADGATPWPSGLAVQAFLEEELQLAAGQGKVLEAPFVADLLLYHPRLAETEQNGDAQGSVGALTFVISPSPRAAQVLLDVGYEKVRLYPFPEETVRGQVVGPTGGSVGDPAKVELTVPEGALSSATVAEVELLSADELAALSQVAGFRTLAAVRLELQGKVLARPATLRLLRPAATADEVAGDPRLILAEQVGQPEDQRGAFARLAARVIRQGTGAGQRLVAAPETEGGLPLDGIVREGIYLLLEATQPTGFATGFVRGQGGVPLQFARVEALPLGTADLARLTGRYAVPVAAGAAQALRALHPVTDEAAAAVVSLAAGQVVVADLTVEAVPPAIQSLRPAENATGQPTLSTVAVLFSEAIDPASVGSGTLVLELVDGRGEPSGVFAAGEVEVSGSEVRFEPTRPLPPGRTFVARFAGGVRDRQGTFYAGAVPVEWRFSTSTVVAPGGQVHPEKFHVEIPENGEARVWAEPGAVPLAQQGQSEWRVAPYLLGPFAGRDPLWATDPAREDGSYEGKVGRPGYPATLASEVWVVVLDPAGQVAAEFEIGPFTSADGKAFVAPPGEATTFRSAEGIVVDVPAGAFDEPTLVRLSLLPVASAGIATPRGLAVGAVVALDFDGEAKETLRLHVPAPAGAAPGAQVFVGEVKQLPWGAGLHFLTYGGVLERGGERFLSNDPSLQAEPDFAVAGGSSQIALRAGGGERTCQDVKTQGYGRCFAEDRLPEFVARRLAVFYHEAGTDWSLIAGFAAPIAQGIGIGAEAILNGLESSWVFLSRLASPVAGFFVLPAITSEPLTLERRDLATGWVLHSQAYSPVPAGDRDLVLYEPLAGDTARRPMLVAAEPFELLHFAAPPEGTSQALRLDVRASTGPSGQVEVKAVPDFPLGELTSLALFDLSSLEPGAEGAATGPVAGPSRTICGEETDWKLEPMPAGDRMLLVIGPGDLDPQGFESFRLEFDFPIKLADGQDPNQLARLRDLGPIDGCKSGSGEGYPLALPVRLERELEGKRLLVIPETALAGGHRFELELVPSGLIAQGADGGGSQLSYWPKAPTRFAFATRELKGETIGTLDPDTFPFGDSSTARDLMRFGNLLLVGSDSGRIVAIDTSEPTEEAKLKLHAISNATTTGVRTFATDGHERLFYTEIFGNTWAVKALRVEDARAAGATCQSQPDWAENVPCFDGVAGSIRIATLPGNALAAAQFLGTGNLPSGTPSDLEVLSQDEKGENLDLKAFYDAYVGSFAGIQPDADGRYTFDLPIQSTYRRFEDGVAEPSRPPGEATPNPRTRQKTCTTEEAYDRFQRVTLDNLTTGQSWSIDVENPWPADGGDGDGKATLTGVMARRGDRLQLRYNLRTLGYVSISGSGISVLDLNRFYRLAQPAISAGNTQCGRRLGRYEGADIVFPQCAVTGSGPEGIRFTPALEVHSETGCATGACRGTGRIDVYSPLLRVGGVHSKSSAEDPGYLQTGELAACISSVGEIFAQPVDAALANDVEWIDYGLRGSLNGSFTEPAADQEARKRRGDLLFLAIGNAGVFVFDVSQRQLGPATLIGHFLVPKRSALRLQFDAARGVLMIGGADRSKTGPSRPVIDLWDVRYVNAAPGTRHLPSSTGTVFVPWSTRHLALDPSGTGLLYTWDPQRGPVALPIDRPTFTFSGLYLPEDEEPPAEGERAVAVDKITSMFVPLGVPMEVKAAKEKENRFENDRKGTAAFKLRIALPGSFGETLSAKVQSLRVLPEERLLGEAKVGEAAALPGGEGWPDPEILVKLRRVGADDPETHGQLGGAYNLYESVETVLLIADPRAADDYRRQDAEEEAEDADEEGQCRRCAWPVYLPDPTRATAEELAGVKQLLAGGRYLRAFLAADVEAGESVRLATEAAIDFFRAQEENYPLPTGWVQVAAPAAAVPSPYQVAMAEPIQNAATFSPGEMEVAVALAGGDLLHGATDHAVAGRGMPFAFDRSYRSQRLGYGPLGSGGWDSSLFAQLREIETTGEVEYHDGRGNVFRFYPSKGEDPGPAWELDDAGAADGPSPTEESALYRGSSYFAPTGLYLRLQKLANREGWRLVGRDKSIAEFDQAGRLRLLSDRIRQAKPVGEQGNSLELRYDAFGKLVEVVDDLGRRHRFEYFEDPVADEERYGLLKSIKDFAAREIAYEYDENRLLEAVELPEVENEIADYAQYSYEGESRPRIEYEYAGDSQEAPTAPSAVAHGDFGRQRLVAIRLPDFGDWSAPRVRFGYDRTSGRLATIAFPNAQNLNTEGSSVDWQIEYSPGTAPATEATITAPWDHTTTYRLEEGRTREVEQELEVWGPTGTSAQQQVKTAFTYRPDGRLASIVHPDGGEDELIYADASLEEGKLDRLSLPNVEKAIRKASPESLGSAMYGEIATLAFYKDDNQVAKIVDGLSRPIQVALPLANRSTETVYETERVRQGQQIDAFGRAKEQVGGADLLKTVTTFGENAKSKPEAGLVEKIAVGTMHASFERDAADNVERIETSLGTSTDVLYDAWDRAVRTISGQSSDSLAPAGAAACGHGRGARSERAFDAAGHLVRERRLQDFVGESGQLGCRWVETRYTYNAREQVVEVRQTQLSDPAQPGAVSSAERLVGKAEFDAFGRLAESHALNQAGPAVVTRYRYDDAGRGVGVRIGDTAEQEQGFDAKNRLVYRSDGDRAVWRGRYDAWDRLWLEQQPTGAHVEHFYDQANNPVKQRVWSGDPSAPRDPEIPENGPALLKETRSTFTSFGEVQQVIEVLSTGENPQVRVTERDFDSAGRVTLVASGPLGAGDKLDRSQARREKEIEYEPETGRVLVEARGGLLQEAPQLEQRYDYEPSQPWPHAVRFFEKIPGQGQLAETQSSSYRRDAFGRVVEEKRNDGSKVETVYDRLTGQPIEVTTGAGATSTVSYDGAGRQVRMTRPNNRGETLYAYDLDGRLLEQRTKTESTDWTTTYGYDAVGRPTRVDYQDGSFTTTTWNPDSTVATQRTRDGLTLTHTYDAANRPLTVVPSGPVPSTLEPLDGGDETTWDALSRLTAERRGDPSLSVTYPSYDLGGRPAEEKVGQREALGWAWDIYDRTIETRLPLGVGRGAESATGFRRRFDTLDQLTSIEALGGPAQTTPLGANWSWGAGRLWGMTTKGSLGTAVRYGYLGGAGAQPAEGGPGNAKWRLGTMTWGSMPNANPEFTATQEPDQIWGQFGFGYRGTEGDPRDGAKIGRLATSQGNDLFAGAGWSWDYDAGVRLSEATPGRGTLTGAPEAEDPSFRYQYGKGDELQQIVDEAAGRIAGIETGAYGRILSRNGAPFSYDAAGRRTEDDRFHYKWSWRGELVEVTVKETWPGDQPSDFAGHQVRYRYDAQSRLTTRSHLSPPDAQGQRRLLEKRAYVWEGQSLLVEAAYANEAETQLQWRKTYIPGPSGLDDAVQVRVENFAAPGIPGSRLYTYLRDELGTVIGLVGEEEGNDPTKPVIPARYLYTPYGEAHIEKGLEIRRVRFEEAEDRLGNQIQTLEEPDQQSEGALIVTFAAALDDTSFPAGVAVDRSSGGEWVEIPAQAFYIGYEDALELKVLAKQGWQRGSSYRVRLTSVKDKQGRGLVTAEAFAWKVAPRGTGSDFSKAFAVGYDTAKAAMDTLGGRFPGGQSSLFQGLWADPVTGISYARARWFDGRNAGWLSEDPLREVDSPNLYVFVGWKPHSSIDPLGLTDSGSGFKEEAFARTQRADRMAATECQLEPLGPWCGTELTRLLRSWLGDQYRPDEAPEIIPYQSGVHRGIFVNGILNPPDRAIFYQRQAELMFGTGLYPIHNPSRGFWMDALQVQFVNKLDIVDETTRAVVEGIRRVLADMPNGENILLVGHSQGAAIVSSAVTRLTPAERARIDLVSIGGAAYGFPGGFHSARMFINTRDIVPMLLGGGAEGMTQIIDNSNAERYYYSTGFPAWFPTTHGVDDYRYISRARPAGATPFVSEELEFLDEFVSNHAEGKR